MAVYVVTWNLNKERSNYSNARKEFLEVLEKYEFIKEGCLESVRFISTTDSAENIVNNLKKKMDENDCLFVSRVRENEYNGLLSQAVWDWIEARV